MALLVFGKDAVQIRRKPIYIPARCLRFNRVLYELIDSEYRQDPCSDSTLKFIFDVPQI